MREILFKAKRLDNGEWEEGFYVCLNGMQHRIYTGYAETDCGDYYPDWFEIDPKTLCQYTGLTDKNGKQIWENDICDRHELLTEIVKQHKGDWTLDYSYALKKAYGHSYCNLGFYVCDRSCVEVIGNIFDNPELLKGGAEHE